MVGSLLTILILSFVVWAHHLYISGMSPFLSDFFAITTLAISVPSVILLTCLVFSLQGGSIRFTTPMLFALSFLPRFGKPSYRDEKAENIHKARDRRKLETKNFHAEAERGRPSLGSSPPTDYRKRARP